MVVAAPGTDPARDGRAVGVSNPIKTHVERGLVRAAVRRGADGAQAPARASVAARRARGALEVRWCEPAGPSQVPRGRVLANEIDAAGAHEPTVTALRHATADMRRRRPNDLRVVADLALLAVRRLALVEAGVYLWHDAGVRPVRVDDLLVPHLHEIREGVGREARLRGHGEVLAPTVRLVPLGVVRPDALLGIGLLTL